MSENISSLFNAYDGIPEEVEQIANLGFWSWDIENDLLHWSKHLLRIYEITPKEFSGKLDGYISRLHPDDRDNSKAIIDKSLKDHSDFTFTERIITGKSHVKFLRTWGKVLLTDSGKPSKLVGICIDITTLKQAETAYEETHAFNAKLVEHTPAAILINLPDDTIVYANTTAARLIKANSADELIGRDGKDFRIDADEETIKNRAKFVLEGGEAAPKYEQAYRCMDGSVKIGESIVVKFEWKGQPAILALINDITERKKNLEALQASERRLRSFIEKTPVAVAMFDNDMNFLACSSKYLDDWWVGDSNLTPKDVLGKNHYDIFPDVKESWKIIHQKALEGQTLINEHDTFTKANGKKEWLRWKIHPWYRHNGTIGGITLFTEFETERREAEEEVKENRNKLNTLIQNLPGMVFSCLNDAHYTMKFVSSGCKELTGYSPSTFLNETGVSFESLIHAEDKETVRKSITDAIANRSIYEVTFRVLTSTGKIIHVFQRGQGLFDDNNELITIEGVMMDVTRQQIIERDLRKNEEDLTASNAELRQFAYMVSHDLRAPVVNIDSLLKLYNNTEPLTDDNQLIFSKIISSVDQLKLTLNDLIKLVEIKDPKKSRLTRINFEEIVDAIISSLETQMGEVQASVKTNFKEAPFIYSKKTTVYSIIQNLISNALKYTQNQNTDIKLTSKKQGDYICLTVSDNGVGIDLDKYGHKIFGMYQRFHQNKEGKGLGLYIIKSQIEGMGGYVEVESQVGKGTSFKVYFKKHESD